MCPMKEPSLGYEFGCGEWECRRCATFENHSSFRRCLLYDGLTICCFPIKPTNEHLPASMRTDPQYLTTFVGSEVCHRGLPMQAFRALISSVAQLNEEITTTSFPTRAKWCMTSICGCGCGCEWSRRVFRVSMPQAIPAGLVPRWHRHMRTDT